MLKLFTAYKTGKLNREQYILKTGRLTAYILTVVLFVLVTLLIAACEDKGYSRAVNEGDFQMDKKDVENTEQAIFAAGCFWGVEASFAKLPGVVDAISGYCGGHTQKPTYKQVCSGDTGHAEAVKVIYDPQKISYKRLLEHFWKMHDPTTPNRQGPDVGSQYRSAIFYLNEDQKTAAEKSRQELERLSMYNRPIVTQIAEAAEFYPAEEYHQNYFKKHPNIYCPH